MHLVDGMLTPPVWGGLAVVGGGGLALALRRAERNLDERQAPLLGVTAAFVFAAQMLNFPVGPGVSAHFVGSALVGLVLGPWSGLVVMAAVLIIQFFLFQDGGLTTLGANFCNLGLLGVGSACLVQATAARMLGMPRGSGVGAFAAGWISSVLPAGAVAVELALSDTLPLRTGLLALVGFHAVTGVAEGLVTFAVAGFLTRVRPEVLRPSRGRT